MEIIKALAAQLPKELTTLILNKSNATLTLNDCLESDSLNKLKRQHSEQSLEIAVFGVVAEHMNLFNAKFHMSDFQIKFFSKTYIQKYGHETLDDLIICLQSAASGEYGIIYNSIDPAIIFEWIMKHLDNKYQQKENLLQRKKITNLQQMNDSPVNKELNKTYCKQIREELEEKRKKK